MKSILKKVAFAAVFIFMMGSLTGAAGKSKTSVKSNSTKAAKAAMTIPVDTKYPMKFTFSSGAGGWENDMELNQDGTFSGRYTDYETGAPIDKVDHICYYSDYTGRFSNLKKIDQYTYSMTLAEITVKDKENTTVIKDKTKYIATSAYGLQTDEDGNKLGSKYRFYLPSTPVSKFTIDFLYWWPGHFCSGDETVPDTLECYAIRNMGSDYGFFTEIP